MDHDRRVGEKDMAGQHNYEDTTTVRSLCLSPMPYGQGLEQKMQSCCVPKPWTAASVPWESSPRMWIGRKRFQPLFLGKADGKCRSQ